MNGLQEYKYQSSMLIKSLTFIQLEKNIKNDLKIVNIQFPMQFASVLVQLSSGRIDNLTETSFNQISQ